MTSSAIWYTAPYIVGLRTTEMTRGAVAVLTDHVVPPTLAAAMKDMRLIK